MPEGLFYLMDEISTSADLCKDLGPVLRIIGIVILGIKIVVPILLIVVGMLDMAKAVNEKSEDKIKTAQKALITKAITAVIVFLVATLVAVVMKLVASDDYKECMTCINDPFSCEATTEL